MRARLPRTPDPSPMHPRVRSRRTSSQPPRLQVKTSPRTATPPRRQATISVPRPTPGMAQVVVKTKYLPAGRASGYADYMTKDKSEGQAAANVSQYMGSHGGQRSDGRAELFTRAGEVVNLDRFLEASRGDPRVWTVIVSPAHGNAMDMQAFARDFMRQVERDTNRTVDWLGAVHTNTDHHHVHVLIRGRDRQGKGLTFPPAYIQRGMRYRAMAIQAQVLSRTRTVKTDATSRGEVHNEVRNRISLLASRVTRQRTQERTTPRTPGGSLSW